jgi:hypothetical protein
MNANEKVSCANIVRMLEIFPDFTNFVAALIPRLKWVYPLYLPNPVVALCRRLKHLDIYSSA